MVAASLCVLPFLSNGSLHAPAVYQRESGAGQGCPSLHKGWYTCRILVFDGAMRVQTTQTEASFLCVLLFLLYGNLRAPAVNQMESGAGHGCTPVCHFTRYDVHIESWHLMGPSKYRQPNGGGFFECIAIPIEWQPSCSCSILKGKWSWSRLSITSQGMMYMWKVCVWWGHATQYRQPNGGIFSVCIAIPTEWKPPCSCSKLKGKWSWSRLYTYLSLHKGWCTCRK